MGKDTSGARAAAAAQQDMSDLANQLANESAPLRRALINDSTNFVTGGVEGTNAALFSSPQYQAAQASIDAQSQRAIDNAIANNPVGGGLSEQLTNIDMQKALGLAGAGGQIAENEMNRATQMATFGAAQGTAGLGQAGNIASALAGMQAQQNAGKSSGAGQAIGSAAAAAIKASDSRLKENIIRLGTFKGLTLYRWTWNALARALGFDSHPCTGVIAQEVPGYTVRHASGYLMVDYGRLLSDTE